MDPTPPPATPVPAPAAPPPRGWWSRNWKWFVPTGCLTLFLMFCAFIAVIAFAAFGMMKSSGAYQDALARAKANPRVIAALGQPIKPGFWVSGNTSAHVGAEEADLTIPISGPKDSGTIYAVSTRSGGQRTYKTLAVEIKKTGERVDLNRSGGLPHDR